MLDLLVISIKFIIALTDCMFLHPCDLAALLFQLVLYREKELLDLGFTHVEA